MRSTFLAVAALARSRDAVSNCLAAEDMAGRDFAGAITRALTRVRLLFDVGRTVVRQHGASAQRCPRRRR